MRNLILLVILGVLTLSAQTSNYPSSLDTNASLFATADNVQTVLTYPMLAADNVAIVQSSTRFAMNQIATVCDTQNAAGTCTAWEHMLITAVNGNVLTVTRAFAGTSAVSHATGKAVAVLIDAAHQAALKAAVIALETAVGTGVTGPQGNGSKVQRAGTNSGLAGAALCDDAGGNTTTSGCTPALPSASAQLQYLRIQPNTGNLTTYQFSGPSTLDAADYNFPAQTPGGSLSTGNQTVALAPCPLGVNGTDTGHYLYISGGTGTAEAAPITGGTCTSGAPSGTVIVTLSYTHSGAWTVTSTSGGIQEAVCALPSAGGQAQVSAGSSITLYSNVSACGRTAASVTKQAGATISGSFTVLGAAPVDVNAAQQSLTGTSTIASQRWDDAGPAWTTFGTNWAGMWKNIGQYPSNGLAFGNAAPTAEALRGAINIPAGTTAGMYHSSGVAGYARTSTATAGAVGVFGMGLINVSGGSAWGSNFTVNNCNNAAGSCSSNGFDMTFLQGAEIDMNVFPLTGGGTPSGDALGLLITGGSTLQPSGRANGVHITSMGFAVPWKNGIWFDDGAATTGIHLGTGATSGASGSIPLEFAGRDAGNVTRTAEIMSDPLGDLIMQAASGVGIYMQDNGGHVGLGLMPNGSTPFVQVFFDLRLPSIKSTTGQRYVCVTTAGDLVSSASACSGT